MILLLILARTSKSYAAATQEKTNLLSHTLAQSSLVSSKESSFKVEISVKLTVSQSFIYLLILILGIAPTDSASIFPDGEFADESFAISHTEPGLLGMCKRGGYANSNESQFYITLGAPLSFMDRTNVIFGRVVNGMRTFRLIEKMDTVNERPSTKVSIDAADMYKIDQP